jgi:hypothetical protein
LQLWNDATPVDGRQGRQGTLPAELQANGRPQGAALANPLAERRRAEGPVRLSLAVAELAERFRVAPSQARRGPAVLGVARSPVWPEERAVAEDSQQRPGSRG